jgi:hypothetical protein
VLHRASLFSKCITTDRKQVTVFPRCGSNFHLLRLEKVTHVAQSYIPNRVVVVTITRQRRSRICQRRSTPFNAVNRFHGHLDVLSLVFATGSFLLMTASTATCTCTLSTKVTKMRCSYDCEKCALVSTRWRHSCRAYAYAKLWYIAMLPARLPEVMYIMTQRKSHVCTRLYVSTI